MRSSTFKSDSNLLAYQEAFTVGHATQVAVYELRRKDDWGRVVTGRFNIN